MPRFEFCPKYKITRNMCIDEIAEMTGMQAHSILSAFCNKHIRPVQKLPRTNDWTQNWKKHIYAAKDVQELLASPKIRRNWQIEGYTKIADAAKKIGISIPTALAYVKEMDLPCVHQNITDCGKTWLPDETINILMKRVWGGRIPESTDLSDYFTTEQIIKECGASSHKILAYVKKAGIKFFNKNRKAYFFPEDAQKIINALGCNLPPEKSEQRKKHPLITDPRCFNFNYWPDPIPLCFKDV